LYLAQFHFVDESGTCVERIQNLKNILDKFNNNRNIYYIVLGFSATLVVFRCHRVSPQVWGQGNLEKCNV